MREEKDAPRRQEQVARLVVDMPLRVDLPATGMTIAPRYDITVVGPTGVSHSQSFYPPAEPLLAGTYKKSVALFF